MNNNVLYKAEITEQESAQLYALDYIRRGYEVMLGHLARSKNNELYEKKEKEYFKVLEEYQLVLNRLMSIYLKDALLKFSNYTIFIDYWNNILFIRNMDGGCSCQK